MGVQAQDLERLAAALKRPTLCPYCGHVLDADTSAGFDESRPKPGDIGLCIRCAGVMVFDADLGRRKITDEEIASLDEETKATIARCKAAHAQMVALHGKPQLDGGGHA